MNIATLLISFLIKPQYIDISHLILLRFLTHPEVNEGSEESQLGAGSEDQQERLHFPVEVNTFHLVEQQEELSEVLKMEVFTIMYG